MFELNQLRCFVAVAEELHFGRAASRLHMTQPPLSRQIQLLEHGIGTALFERSNRTVRLTLAGRRLLPEARTLLRLANSASLATLRVGTGEAGRVGIGFTATAGYQFLPNALTRLRKRLPGIDLELREMVSQAQLEALDNGQLDLGLLRPPVSRPGMRNQRLAREALVAAFPVGHPLATHPKLRLRDFHDQLMVMYSPDEARYFYDLISRLFSAAGIAPRYNQYVSQVHSVLALVRAGLGAALVPEAASHLRYDGIVFRRITRLVPARPVELHMVWKEENNNPALKRVLDLLESQEKRR